jgi:NADP-dependent 3-hydroxy acid dehydrogenase YdfG
MVSNPRFVFSGNALTDMAAPIVNNGFPQADGSMKKETSIDAKHVASSIVHIASLPLEVTVLQINVM